MARAKYYLLIRDPLLGITDKAAFPGAMEFAEAAVKVAVGPGVGPMALLGIDVAPDSSEFGVRDLVDRVGRATIHHYYAQHLRPRRPHTICW